MNWKEMIEVGEEAFSLEEIQEALMASLSRDEMEEFAGELIKWAEFEPRYGILLE